MREQNENVNSATAFQISIRDIPASFDVPPSVVVFEDAASCHSTFIWSAHVQFRAQRTSARVKGLLLRLIGSAAALRCSGLKAYVFTIT